MELSSTQQYESSSPRPDGFAKKSSVSKTLASVDQRR